MWMPRELGDVIAVRRAVFVRARRRRTVEIAFGRPVKGPERRDPWWCVVRIGAPINFFKPVAGQDSLQALVLALELVQKTLPSFARHEGGTIEWLSEREQLVFAGTYSITMQWDAIMALTQGLARAVEALEQRPRPARALLDELRHLVARQGVIPRAATPAGRRRRRAGTP